MDRIDFRSDTVSWPTPKMREAMATAAVGDDVYGEDPTVNALQALAAEMTGKEAGLLVNSGTQGNLVSLLSHATRGEQIILGNNSHIFLYEAGGMAVVGGMMPNPLPTDEIGRLSPDDIHKAIRPDDAHFPVSKLLCVENGYGTKHNYPLPPSYFAKLREVADQHGLSIHMDGARVWNSAVAQGIDVREITQYVDSLTFCLSKGLCAPVGSVVCGTAAFIKRAHRARKLVGGGMRQAGIVAAAGIVALTDMVDRLAEDHHHAKMLADGLAQIPGITVNPEMVKTNMIFFGLADNVELTKADVVKELRERANIYVGGGPYGFRAVTHYWINATHIETFLDSLNSILNG